MNIEIKKEKMHANMLTNVYKLNTVKIDWIDKKTNKQNKTKFTQVT